MYLESVFSDGAILKIVFVAAILKIYFFERVVLKMPFLREQFRKCLF